MTTPLPQVAIPGQCLGSASKYTAGPGTHIQQSNIYASIAGPVILDPAQPNTQTKSILRVSRTIPAKPHLASTSKSKDRYNTLPAVNSIVLARVTRVQKRQATVSILVVLDEDSLDPAQTSDNDNIASILTSAANPENHSTTDELRFQALIRKEDVRAVEKDRVIMDEMFRVGDIVRGSVISLGDQSFYYITTSRNDLGVVMARSEGGNMMFPVSWKEMRDPITNASELRKVARPY
ncbi:exoribonuclease [Penicillium angulare]|uniref:exoribonuclease n=1 Tax=Penicillium angulare TaxID=116970 RepID=UPI002541B852|nr:exoribonuclease [Penicillium angulare]KAJ5279630.1 exoribonuclease [Penicillium angulare]